MAPVLVITVIVGASRLQLVAWQPPVLWQHLLGSGSTTVVDSDSSGIYAEGYNFSQSLGGSGSLFLNKYDASGGVVWNRTMNDSGGRFFREMSVGPEGIYLSGENVSGRIFLKCDLTGNKLWEKVDSVDSISAVSVGVYVTEGGRVRQYDSAGDVIWTSEFSNDTVVSSRVYASSSGVFVIYAAINRTRNLGPFLLKYNLTGNQIWSRLVPAAGGISGDSNGVYLTGPSLYKYDFNGDPQWTTQINSPDGSQVYDSLVSVDGSGIYVSAYTYRFNSYLFKYNLAGGPIWNFRLPPSVQDADSTRYAYRLSPIPRPLYLSGPF